MNAEVEQAKEDLRWAYMTLDFADPKDPDMTDAAILGVEVARLRLNSTIREAKTLGTLPRLQR